MLLTACAIVLGPALLLRPLHHWCYALHTAIVMAIIWLASQHNPDITDFSAQAFSWAFVLHLISLNLITFFAYGWDKRAARNNNWRVPERTLHMMSLVGGTLGAAIGQRYFRHKTRKSGFQIIFIMTFILQLIIAAFLIAIH